MENPQRPKVNFHPDVWGDAFLKCPDQDIDAATELQHEQMKREIRRLLVANKESLNQKLSLIDDVQRLGVSYHFEKEIEDELENIHHEDYDENDLYTTALRFRLLREHGFNVSCDIFNKFKDEQGNFKSSLTSDVRGLLELYEASYLRVHGEDILDEAISFTRTQLNLAILATLDHPLSEKVAHALRQSIRRGLPRVESRRYISIYQDFESHNKILLEFAKLDFNLVQLLHKKELSGICRWWKNFDLKKKLPFVRDRVVEGYFWILGVYFEPRYTVARWMMTKVIAMASIVDDVYDSYGTYEELLLYTDAIERWDIKYMDQLPDYMKISCYKALLDVYEEMKELLADGEKEFRIEYAKKAWIPVAQAFLLEKKWMQQKLKPTFEEYKANALVTCGYAMLAVTSYVGMGNVVTEETFDWAFKSPKIIRASEIICRFMDDVAEHKFKHKGEDDCSAIECYMAEYGVSAQEAYDEFYKHVEDAWKDINKEFLKPTAMPMEVLSQSLNLARVMDVLYKDGDGYTYVGKVTKDGITSLLVDPIPL